LYGGLYTFNAITDIESDLKHPFKRRRPLPSREVSLKSAGIFSLILIAGGMLTGLLLFGHNIFYVYVVFLALNAFYSLVAKRIPYLELMANAATHPLRFLMGALLANGSIPIAMLAAYFFLAFGVVTVRRCVEKNVEGWEARETLETYTDQMLYLFKSSGLVAILMVSVIDTSVPKPFYWATLAIYFTLVFGTDFYAPMRHILVRIWTR
jgi:4-hydroxybenzoate polyprenyltransferase